MYDSRKYASKRKSNTGQLASVPYPISIDPSNFQGSWIISDGQMFFSDGTKWKTVQPDGIELMLPPWADVPAGWIANTDYSMEGELSDRTIASNYLEPIWTGGTEFPMDGYVETTYNSGIALNTDLLVTFSYPLGTDENTNNGAWNLAINTVSYTTDRSEMFYSNGTEWSTALPLGTELLLPSWQAVPVGWFETRFRGSGALDNRRVITNKVDRDYFDENLLSYIDADVSDIYQDSAATIPVTSYNEPVGYVQNLNGVDYNWTQVVNGNRPTYEELNGRAYFAYATADSNLVVNTGPFQGTLIESTNFGTYAVVVSTSANLTIGNGSVLGTTAAFVYDRILAASEQEAFIDFVVRTFDKKRKSNFSTATSLAYAWNNRPEILAFPVLDTAFVTDFTRAWKGCSSLSNFPRLSTFSAQTFYEAWKDCSGLATFPALFYPEGCSVEGAWEGCTSLRFFDHTSMNDVVNVARAWQNTTSFVYFGVDGQVNTAFFNNCVNFYAAFRNSNLSTLFYTRFGGDGTLDIGGTPGDTERGFYKAFENSRVSSLSSNTFDNCNTVNYRDAFKGCRLSSSIYVNYVLCSIRNAAVKYDLYNGEVGIDGGTNAAPSENDASPQFDGLIAKAELEARGWVIYTN